MALELPQGDMGTKNLPVPVAPQIPLSPDLGERAVQQQQQKSTDALDPVIQSLSYLNDSLDSMVSTVGDMEPITVGELEKLLQKYFSKTEVSDSITEAFSKNVSQVGENSFFVKNQVKAAEVEQKTIKKEPPPEPNNFESVFGQGKTTSSSSSGNDSSSSGSNFSATGAFNTALNTAHDFAFNPMSLIDKIAELPFKGIDALKNRKGKKNKEDFYGDFEESKEPSPPSSEKTTEDFFGSDFPAVVGEIVGDSFQPVEDGFAEIFTDTSTMFQSIQDGLPGIGMAAGPLGTVDDPLYVVTLSMKERDMINDTTSGSPSDAGLNRWASEAIEGSNTRKKSGAGNAETVEEKAAKTSIKSGEVVHSTFTNPEQSKFGGFLDKTFSGGGGTGMKAEGGWLAIIIGVIAVALFAFKDLVTEIFERVLIPLGEVAVDFFRALKDPFIRLVNAFVDVAVVAFGIIKEVLLAIQPYIVDIAVIIIQTVKVVLETVLLILEAVQPYLIRMAEVLCGIIVVVLEIVKEVLVVLKEPILKIVNIVTTVVVDALELIGKVLGTIFKAVEPLVAVLGKVMGGVVGAVSKGLDVVSDKVGGALNWVGDKIGAGLSWIGEKVSEPDPTTESLFKALTDDMAMPDKEIPLLQGIFQHTFVISEILVSHFKEEAKGISKRKVNDLVISTEGKEFYPTNDAVFAINSGMVSVIPSQPVNEYNGGNISSNVSNSQVQNSTNGVVNNYYSSANYDMSGMSPFSEFCPVGV